MSVPNCIVGSNGSETVCFDTNPPMRSGNTWVRIPVHVNGEPCYFNTSTGEIAVEVIQDARLVVLTPEQAQAIRTHQLGWLRCSARVRRAWLLRQQGR